MKTLISLLKKHTETCNKRYNTLQTRLNSELNEINGLVANVDYQGRLHAACDGYCDVSNNVYAKGQYIPMPETEDDCFFGSPSTKREFKTRIQICSELIEQGQNLDSNDLDGVKLGFGKVFQKNSIDTCYMYVEATTMGYLNIVTDFVSKLVKETKERIEAETPKKEKGIAPEGKQLIEGVILGLPVTENFYGIQSKMFVELENGSTVYGSLPSKIFEAEIGDKVSFSANFTHADEDDTHAFFKRPTKAQIIK